MISKSLYLNILVRLLFLLSVSVLFGFLIANDVTFRYLILCFLIIVMMTVNLISYLNGTNQKIMLFFDSVRNDDSTLSFATTEKNKTVREIYKSMNKVNHQIQQLKIENRKQEQYFRILIEHIATGIITFDNDGFIIHANAPARRLLSAEVLTHLKQIERKDQKLFDAIKSIRPDERRLIAYSSENGEIQLSLKATSFRTDNKELIILSIQDIKNELDEKELESWMKLIRVLMHEIMNSIAPITSLSESLVRIYTDSGVPVLPEKVSSDTINTTLQGLNVIKEQGKGLMILVESYRKLTRIPEPDKKYFAIEDLMSRLEILYKSMNNSDRAALSVTIKNRGNELFADQNLVSQVLVNLLKNALEANENNPDPKIRIIAGPDINGRPEICVVDNGPGIAPEHMDEIFVPFFTTRQNGSGIGLSISKQIMKMHGGNLKVRSIPGRETAFCLNF
jgi:two-component system, NtrC family, nitrogen regulation sensor histidine kinase NtrY